jgi:hypothetical protein
MCWQDAVSLAIGFYALVADINLLLVQGVILVLQRDALSFNFQAVCLALTPPFVSCCLPSFTLLLRLHDFISP